MIFKTQLSEQIAKKQSNICVGLDSDYEKLPESVKKDSSLADAVFQFNKEIIDATADITPVYKLNMVCYAGYGIDGLIALKRTNEYIKKNYPEIKIIVDSKRSEMKRTAELAAKELFDEFLFDATTVTPWFGFDTIEPFLNYKDKAVFVLCHDSNPSAGDLQDVTLQSGEKLYEYLTKMVVGSWDKVGNILVEGPLTYPDILKRIIELSPDDQFFLAAGLGAQGGNIEDLKLFPNKDRFVVNASRSVIFASPAEDFAEKSHEVVEEYRKTIRLFFE
ncbi:orotidine-5'-phosphate decarboxylase [Candidatus Roizmanbacteria bacterium]|nr:MAG: orotidine-5'-phosphate decarboxylase [Candidatus Roizmanbacteria bacterium]